MNLVTLVGRLVNDPEIEEKENNKVCNITLAINRKYKNVDGIYETDFIKCRLWKYPFVNTVKEYCEKGDLIGVRGMLQVIDNEMIVVVESVTFLSSK
jgi:single-strand DNA-binding protein